VHDDLWEHAGDDEERETMTESETQEAAVEGTGQAEGKIE
jgi:hypothetical protein